MKSFAVLLLAGAVAVAAVPNDLFDSGDMMPGGDMMPDGDMMHGGDDWRGWRGDSEPEDLSPLDRQCKEISHLAEFVERANNKTELARMSKNDPSKAADIQAKAQGAEEKLQTLETNATLVAACQPYFGQEEMEQMCFTLRALERLEELASNQTELDAITDNNATRSQAIQAKATEAASTLATLQSNTTLTAYCEIEDTKEACREIQKLQHELDFSASMVSLSDRFEDDSGNQSAVFQAVAAALAEALTEVKSNATLTATCRYLNIPIDNLTNSESSSAATLAARSPIASLSALMVLFASAVLLL
jgi:hypothetical protein